MRVRKMEGRNREILLSSLAGESVNELAARYGLRPGTVAAILTSERHKCAVSPSPEYRALREYSVPSNQI